MCSSDLDVEEAANAPLLFAQGSVTEETGEHILKLVNVSDKAQTVAIELAQGGTAYGTLLTHEDSTSQNTLENPDNVRPVDFVLGTVEACFHYEMPPNSFVVLRIKA